MESPKAIVKSVLNPSYIIKGLITLAVLNAILSLLGISTWFYNPVEMLKAKFGKQS